MQLIHGLLQLCIPVLLHLVLKLGLEYLRHLHVLLLLVGLIELLGGFVMPVQLVRC